MILVTGGTGLIGSHLLFHLTAKGEKVKANYRDKQSINKVLQIFGYYTDTPKKSMAQITWVQADITDIGALDNLFDGIDRVYHCAALISFDPKDRKALIKNNIQGTANIVNLSIQHQVKKLCYVSSIAAIGQSIKEKEATEETEWNSIFASIYGISKHEGELEVWRGAQEGLDVVIVNPGVVLGPGFWGNGSGAFFTYAAKKKNFYIPGGTGFVSVNDAVLAMQKLMDSKINRERYILVNQNLSYKELFEKTAVRFNYKPPSKMVPFWALEIFWRVDLILSRFFGKKRTLTRNMTKGLYKQQIYNGNKIKHAVDFEYENLDEVLNLCCEKFKDYISGGSG